MSLSAMPKNKKVRWKFWVLTTKKNRQPGTPTQFEYVPFTPRPTSTSKWPTDIFKKMADVHGFTNFHKTQDLIGGYFSSPKTGDALYCIPADKKPEEVYPL